MKKLTGLVVLVAALVLGGYYGMGVVTERTVKHDLDMVNQSNGVFVEVTDYQRGWFNSHAMLNWRFQVPQRMVQDANGQMQMVPAKDYDFQMPMDIYHGPFIFAHGVKFGMGYAESSVTLPTQLVQQFKDVFTADSTQPRLVLSLMVNYLNSSNLKMSVPEFKLIDKKNQGQLDWMGMSSSVRVNSSMNKMRGNVTIDGITFSKEGVSAMLGEMVSNYDLYRTDSGLILGDFSVNLPSFVVKNKDAVMFELDSFDLSSSNGVSSGLFHAEVKSSLEKIIAQGKTYGPGRLELTVKNLDADALARINAAANKAQNGSQVEKQKAMLAVMPELPKLFSRGVEIAIPVLSFKLPEGTIEGNLMLSLPEMQSVNPIQMMQKLEGKGQLKMPAEVLKQLVSESIKKNANAQNQQNLAAAMSQGATSAQPQATESVDNQINTMLQSGFIVKQGNDYIISFNLSNGKLMVNDKPFNPSMMKF